MNKTGWKLVLTVLLVALFDASGITTRPSNLIPHLRPAPRALRSCSRAGTPA